MKSFAFLLLIPISTTAFTIFTSPKITKAAYSSPTILSATIEDNLDELLETEKRNPKNPNLPELKGDYDWDEKFGADDDWMTLDVPGKIVMNDVELASQVTKLNSLEEKWRKGRVQGEYEAERLLGWTGQAETYNGRFAMFFLVVGLLTEYWTGITIPGQIEEMLRITGFIDIDM